MDKQGIRLRLSYAYWAFLGQVLAIGIPRLVFYPVLASLLGKEYFGVFVTAMGISLIIGTQPANGLINGLLRYLSNVSDEEKLHLCSTALRMDRWAVTIIIVACNVIIGVSLGFLTLDDTTLFYCLIPLALSLYPDNQLTLILAKERYDREFRTRTIWFAFKACVGFFTGTMGAYLFGTIGAAWGYLIGSQIVYLILRRHRKSWFEQPYSPEMAIILRRVWLQMSISGVIVVSGPYITRVVLSAITTYSDVAEFVAANSIVALVHAPVTCAGNLIMSLFSRYSTVQRISRGVWIEYLLLLGSGIFLIPLLFLVVGDWMLALLYPTFVESASKLLDLLVWTLPPLTMTALFRPLVVKFGSIKLVPIINAISFVALLLPSVVWIPKYGVHGAAYSIIVASAITGLCWCYAVVRLLKKSSGTGDGSA